jgi:alkylhydroperoxidase family enzyme
MTAPPWRAHAPAAFALFDRIEAIAAATVDAALLDPVRVAVATALAHPEESLRTPVGAPSGTPDPRAEVCVRFAEQFVVDVSGIDDELRGALGVALAADTFAFTQALYVVDVFQRGRIALERLFDTPYGPALAPETGDLWPVLEEYMRVVALGSALDPVTTELVRLRGARAHQCRVCQSRLSLRAVEAAGDASIFEAVDGGARTDRERAALELTDALVSQPTSIDGACAHRLHDRLTDAEITEIVLDVVRNGANKIAVALGGDAPEVTDGIQFYDVDATGEVVADVDREVVRSATAPV